jgi:hypothetical protein
MSALANVTWDEITSFRSLVQKKLSGTTIEQIAGQWTRAFVTQFPTIALARLFLVIPYGQLPEDEQLLARASLDVSVVDTTILKGDTPVLCLLATNGIERAWNDRKSSQGHRVIPLMSRSAVESAPMIYNLLASLGLDYADLGVRDAIAIRELAGGLNKRFYVPDAASAIDERGRHIIPAQDFVEKYKLRTVFGMGGSYVNGIVAISIFFTKDSLPPLTVDFFPSFIGLFKLATSDLVTAGKIFKVET